MPVPGRIPKPKEQTRHRNRPAHDWADVLDVPFGDGPSLPRTMPNGAPWPAWTKRWWKTLSSMPHCKLWAPSDWEFAFDTAALKAQFHASGRAAMATEIRNREKVLGTTADYRRSLRIRYVTVVENETPAKVVQFDDYREL
jgi:hypothetical protein